MKVSKVLLNSIIALTFSIASSNLLLAEFQRPKISTLDPYQNSLILKSGNDHTVLPKKSLIFTPERHKKRISNNSSGGYVPWSKFKAKNFAWIHTFEVTLDQAKGIEPIPKATMERLKKLDRMVIAVRKKNPISIVPPKTDE